MKNSLHYTVYETELGKILMAATEQGICLLQFAATSRPESLLKKEFPQALIQPMPAVMQKKWSQHLKTYLKGKSSRLEWPLDIRGTTFQMSVWQYLQTIPSGEVRSYSEVAKAIKNPTAVRAVASACARNCIALFIPCHRVIRGDGHLAGYRWGIPRKRQLLALEKRCA